MNQIYLDNCSTTPLDPQVYEAMSECFRAGYVNPASQHRPGQRAAARLEQARQQIGRELKLAPDDRLVFTSGGTEANNLAVLGLCDGGMPPRSQTPPNIVVSDIEHPSILSPAAILGSRGWSIRSLPVDANGVARIDELPRLIDEHTRLASLMLVNNETGVIQPVVQAARICAAQGVPLHCDAVQAVGKIPVSFAEMSAAGVTALTLTAHKLHGPRGIGALLVGSPEPDLQPLLFGGFQQLGTRPGTEDVALAAGFAEAVQIAVGGLDSTSRETQSLRDSLEQAILSAVPDACVNGQAGPRAPHCSNIGFPGSSDDATVDRQALMLACDMAGLAISTGSACASGSSDPSPVLRAMGLENRVVESSIRVSFSRFNTMPECLQAADRITKAVKHLRRPKSVRK